MATDVTRLAYLKQTSTVPGGDLVDRLFGVLGLIVDRRRRETAAGAGARAALPAPGERTEQSDS